jgi:cell division protein FtsB
MLLTLLRYHVRGAAVAVTPPASSSSGSGVGGVSRVARSPVYLWKRKKKLEEEIQEVEAEIETLTQETLAPIPTGIPLVSSATLATPHIEALTQQLSHMQLELGRLLREQAEIEALAQHMEQEGHRQAMEDEEAFRVLFAIIHLDD